ncbi:MAG: rod shape-determining protein MreC [bacterium]
MDWSYGAFTPMNLLALLSAWRDWVAITFALILSLILMNSSEHPAAEVYRQGMSQAIAFLSEPLTIGPRTLELWSDNKRLRQDIIELTNEKDNWRDAMLENIRLRKLLGFRDRPEFTYLASEVIARDPLLTLSSLLLDKGRRDSVKAGQAVVTAEGIAGIIYRADRTQSVALLATDRNFAASARVERSRVDGIIRWAGGGMLEMTEVPRNLDIRVGDRVVTSGLGGVIPGGLPVGVVIRVMRNEGLFLKVIVEPYVEYSRLEEVFVLLPVANAGGGKR